MTCERRKVTILSPSFLSMADLALATCVNVTKDHSKVKLGTSLTMLVFIHSERVIVTEELSSRLEAIVVYADVSYVCIGMGPTPCIETGRCNFAGVCKQTRPTRSNDC